MTDRNADAVVCRLHPVNWVIPAVCTLFAALPILVPLGAKEASSLVFPWGLSSGFFAIALGVAVWVARARILTDDKGLRWRSFSGWRSASWDEVTDYYLVAPKSDRGTAPLQTARVETLHSGTLTFWQEWAGHEELRNAIRHHATAALANDWERHGVRPGDSWPRVFHYDTWINRWGSLICAAFMGACAVCGAGMAVSIARENWNLLGPVMTTALSVVLGALFIGVPLLVAFLLLQTARAVRQRLHQRFTVTPEGFEFSSDGSDRVRASWGQVTGYQTIRGRGSLPEYEIILQGEEQHVTFSGAISEVRLLLRIVQRYAPSSAGEGWADETELDAPPATLGRHWAGGVASTEGHVFHYRTMQNRLLLGTGAALILGSMVRAWIDYKVDATEGRFPLETAIACALGGGVWAWLFWRQRAAAIEVDDLFITQRAPCGCKRIAWIGVVDYYGAEVGTIVGRDGTRIRFSFSLLGNGRALRTEIARRAPRPVTGWGDSNRSTRGVRCPPAELEAIDTHEDEVRNDGGDADGAGRQDSAGDGYGGGPLNAGAA